MRDDRELLRDYVEKASEEAFRALVDRHAGMVHGAALRLVQDVALADEIAQAVFILLARKASTLRAGCLIAGWLHQTTRFVARGALRAERRRQHHYRDFHDLASMNDLAESTAAWDQIRPHLDESLAQLGAGDRNAIVLRFLEGRSFAEVGSALGTSEAAAKMRVGRALEKLRQALRGHGVIVTLAVLTPALAAQVAPAAPAALLTQIAGAALAPSAPAPSLLLLVNDALKLMTLQKLKTAAIAAVVSLLILGGGAALFRFALPATQPAALLVTSFEPMVGEWEGTYEMRTEGQPGTRRQRVALSIRTTNRGRTCEIDMSVVDRNDQPTATFHFTHALNAAGDRILTTDDPSTGRDQLDGLVTESTQNTAAGEWRAAFRATRPARADVTSCRWVRQGDDLFINRQDMMVTPQGSSRLFSDLTLRPRVPTAPADTTKPRTAFNALPRGTQSFDGVTFNIRRPINLIGARAGRARGREFARVSDPSVRGRGKHIHVLHTGDHGSAPTGDFIWRLVLHYADGGTERFDFAYDIHLRNYWRRAGDGPAAPSDPDTSLAWVGTSQESDRKGADLVVSRTTLANPRPGVDVTSAEFVSLLGLSSAYVLAVTVGDSGPPPVRSSRPSFPNAPPLTFVVQDAAGQAQPGATLDVEFECEGFSVRLAQARTDDQGRVTIDVPTEVVRAIQYQARQADGRTGVGGMEVMAGEKGWPAQVVRLTEEIQ